jgi:GAF domain-containing protein
VTGYTTRNILTLPIQDNSNRTAAVIQVINKKRGVFTREDEGLMMSLSRSAGQILRKAQLFSALLVEQRKVRRTANSAQPDVWSTTTTCSRFCVHLLFLRCVLPVRPRP